MDKVPVRDFPQKNVRFRPDLKEQAMALSERIGISFDRLVNDGLELELARREALMSKREEVAA